MTYCAILWERHEHNLQGWGNFSTQISVFCGGLFKDLRPGKLPCPLHRDELNLGDIFLGVEFVMKQCQEESLDLYGALTV